MKLRRSPQGFTLIELLVVISIIAILAGIAVPTFQTVVEKGNQTKDLSNAKQIYLGLKLYATDNDGTFPQSKYDPTSTTSGSGSAISNANEAFQNICPVYVGQEKIFYLPKSPWTPKAPDENTTSGNALIAGENSFAYVKNLSDTSNPSYPIIADGFTVGGESEGTYSTDESVAGGVWKGKAAIVIRVDGSGKVERCTVTGAGAAGTGVINGPIGGTTQAPIFKTADNWLTATQTALNPLTP